MFHSPHRVSFVLDWDQNHLKKNNGNKLEFQDRMDGTIVIGSGIISRRIIGTTSTAQT